MSDTPRTDKAPWTFTEADWNSKRPQRWVKVEFARELERENAELRADKERLDWLTNSLGWIIVGEPEADPSQHATEGGTLADAWRAAVDAARKEAKP